MKVEDIQEVAMVLAKSVWGEDVDEDDTKTLAKTLALIQPAAMIVAIREASERVVTKLKAIEGRLQRLEQTIATK